MKWRRMKEPLLRGEGREDGFVGASKKPGSKRLLGCAALTLGCALADFAWSSPGMPKTSEPFEALEDASGVFRISRYLLLFVSCLCVSVDGLAAIAIQLDLKQKLAAIELVVLLHTVLSVLAAASDFLSGDRFYTSRTWQGPFWAYSLVATFVANIVTVDVLLKSKPASDLSGVKMNCKWFISVCHKFPIVSAGTGFALSGVVLFLVGLGFYRTEPRDELFASLSKQDMSFLEFHVDSGELHLLSSTGQAVAHVTWGSSVGVKIEELVNHRTVFETFDPSRSFLIASMSGGDATRLKVMEDPQAGTFSIRDTHGTLSTEQVVERVTIKEDSTEISFFGYLYYGPFGEKPEERLGWKKSLAWRSFFEFNISTTQSDDGSTAFKWTAQVDAEVNDRTYLVFKSSASERIFGLGESYTYMDLKGGIIPVLSREQGIGRGLEPLSFFEDAVLGGLPSGTATQFTYSATPHFLTTELRSFSLQNSEFAVMDFSNNDRIAVEVNATYIGGVILSATSPTELVKRYVMEVSGQMRPLPSWTGEGAVLGLQGGKAKVMSKLKTILDAGTPVSAIWLQDWSGQRNTTFGSRLLWNWQVDENHYPNWFAWIQELYDNYNVSVLSYINPYLAEGFPMFEQAKAKNCLLVADDHVKPLIQFSGTPDFRFGTVDISKDACFDWYANVIRTNMIGNGSSASLRKGVMGWMADFGESIPFEVTSPELHNRFPELWAKLNRHAISGDTYSSENVVFFTRSSSLHTPAYSTLNWMGDQLTSWDKFDGLHSALIGQLSAGLSGLLYSHSDIGGYTMLDTFPFRYFRDAELFMRWAEYSAFADSIFRTHEGLLPDRSVQAWHTPVLSHFSRFAKVHKAMWRVRRSVQEAEPSLPFMRSMWLHYHEDRNTTHLKTQFLVGSKDMIMCPVLVPGSNSTSCYIPAGVVFEHVFTRQCFGPFVHGQSIRCNAAIGVPCVLVNPMNHDLQLVVQELKRILL